MQPIMNSDHLGVRLSNIYFISIISRRMMKGTYLVGEQGERRSEEDTKERHGRYS